MSNLQYLNLAKNRLTTIDSAWWSELGSLTKLNLSQNSIYPSRASLKSRKSTRRDNLIMVVDRGCLAGLTTLKKINLLRNRIADVSQVIVPKGCKAMTDDQKKINEDASVMYGLIPHQIAFVALHARTHARTHACTHARTHAHDGLNLAVQI
jgi:Leucine-rich repeat (LRR) protein